MSSFSSEMQSAQAREGKRHAFHPVSYSIERRTGTNQEIINHYNRIARGYKVTINDLRNEKSQLKSAIKREATHIAAVRQEKEDRETAIQETLSILVEGKSGLVRSHPPSISQLKRISDAILEEGLKFKKQSEIGWRIETELGSETLGDVGSKMLDLAGKGRPEFDMEMPSECRALAGLIYKRVDYRLRLAMVVANRDMLSRMIYDYQTALETIKVKKQALSEENSRLECDLEGLLDSYSRSWGEYSWKHEVLKKTAEIADMGMRA
jgi:predicted  nucleic acid-binding Zn-ribbon protein